jgi:hypothetical protein
MLTDLQKENRILMLLNYSSLTKIVIELQKEATPIYLFEQFTSKVDFLNRESSVDALNSLN